MSDVKEEDKEDWTSDLKEEGKRLIEECHSLALLSE